MPESLEGGKVMLYIHSGCPKWWICYFMSATVHTSAWSFSISLLPVYYCKQATSEDWYALLTRELETLCVMALYSGERILYN